MPLELHISTTLDDDPASKTLVQSLANAQDALSLHSATLYYDFPLYRDDEGTGIVTSKVLVLSPRHGVLLFGTCNGTTPQDLSAANDSLEHVFSHIFSRLLKNRQLRRSKQELSCPIHALLYAPTVSPDTPWESDTELLRTDNELDDALEAAALDEDLNLQLFAELASTLEGAKGIIKPKPRNTSEARANSKGQQAGLTESEINNFDRQQKNGYIVPFNGPQRIRGLAGSGKTVVLAMKAAITHLRYPDARIVYTFHTKSLYQHIRRLITRFFRQYSENDPDWDRLKVLHSWGGSTWAGVYSLACHAHGHAYMNLAEALRLDRDRPFEAACSKLLASTTLRPMYDFAFIDEGQDFAAPFIRLCQALVEGNKFALAYDELQTIWQSRVPSVSEIFGDAPNAMVDFENDVVLYKCYRNPREILVCAHALGFGIYADHIVQMLENSDHWIDIGYKVLEGDFREGSRTVIERPPENSLRTISEKSSLHEIVQTKVSSDSAEEVQWIANSIASDLADGLRPDDIMVITIDDRNARDDLTNIGRALRDRKIRGNNTHTAGYGPDDFQIDEAVTLTTVHKAKGNEAFMVYVMGADAAYPKPTVRERNMLFTAMTRAKGWVRVSGAGEDARACVAEIEEAKAHFPHLVFSYPSEAQLKVMRRDLEERASRRLRAERLVEQALIDLSPEEIEMLVKKQSRLSKKVRPERKKRRS